MSRDLQKSDTGSLRRDVLNTLTDATVWSPSERINAGFAQNMQLVNMGQMLSQAASKHLMRFNQSHSGHLIELLAGTRRVAERLRELQAAGGLREAWAGYLTDSAQRWVLTLDTLRERGDNFIAHEVADCPAVLIYDHEIVMDGADLPRPCNYYLMRIIAPEGVVTHDWKRPYVIVDPRAGHGAGIGGFKPDSQVGVALRDGHPVYFVGFRRRPEPGQTLADVAHAEAEFIREVARRHPDAPNPIIAGNCQGGWAVLILAATNPDLTGPIVLNGAPVDTWAGRLGEYPMRYNAGVLGGVINPMLQADLGHGTFDGAHIVSNFEQLNPSRTQFGKYYNLFANVDTERQRFLDFERWWGGFFLFNEAEMRWIVEQLFVGNRLVHNEARLEPGRNIDVKNVRAPIIVFASHGDTITPPQQALNWILRSYSDEREIQIRGQRIIYLFHDQVGHLGIFVSSKIAKKEHTEVASTMKTIEALAPGLYEMKIDDIEGEGLDKVFTVSFHARRFDDLRAIDDGTGDEVPFAAVARMSEQVGEFYDLALRPLVQATATEGSAEVARKLHPARLSRALLSSQNPLVAPIEPLAERVRQMRAPADRSNPFVQLRDLWAEGVRQSLDIYRDLRDMSYEMAFLSLWSTPWARWYGRGHEAGRTLKRAEELRWLPSVQAALLGIEQGGFIEAVIRMLVLLADSRGAVRRDRLERSARVLTQDEPFRSIPAEDRMLIIHEQTMIAHFEPQRAVETLPALLESEAERRLAAEVVQYIPGAIEEMSPRTLALLQKFRAVLGLPEVTTDITEDPLGDPAASAVIGAVAE